MGLLLTIAVGLLGAQAPATLYVAPGGSDANDCRTPVTACASFDRGYHAAAPGDVVELAGGNYPGPQLFSPDPSKTSPADVVVRPAPGAHVLIQCDFENNCLATEGADHLTVQGVTTAMLAPLDGKPRQSGVSLDRGSEHVTFRDVDAGHIFIAADRDASVVGGDYGPTVDRVSKISDDVGPNVLIDGARFHDHLYQDMHMECIALYGARGVVIRRSRFDTCWAFAIFSAPGIDEHYRDVLIENNFFSNSGDAEMSSHVKISSHGGDCSNFLIRNNTFIDENVISHCGIEEGTATNIRWIANVFSEFNTRDNCQETLVDFGHVFDYNVIEDGHPCGPHDVAVGVGNAGFVNREAIDLHLAAGSPAIDRGSPEHPATDIDGNPRPFGAAPDAGADEHGSTGGGAPGGGGGGPGVAADRSAPRLTVRLARRMSLRRVVRRRRLVYRVTCSEPCRLKGTARRPGRRRVVARGKRRLAAADDARVVVRIKRRTARRLRRAERVRLRVRTTATDAAGNRRTVVRRTTLRRRR